MLDLLYAHVRGATVWIFRLMPMGVEVPIVSVHRLGCPTERIKLRSIGCGDVKEPGAGEFCEQV